MAKISLGATGVTLKVRIRDEDTGLPLDLSPASLKDIYIVSPRGTVKKFTASFNTDGIDGRIKYVTVSGDLDEVGNWIIYAHVTLPTLDTYSSEKSFEVFGRR